MSKIPKTITTIGKFAEWVEQVSHLGTQSEREGASSPQFQVPTCYCDIGQVAGCRITAGQGNTVPQDATQNSFFDFMAEPWLLPKRGDHENKWLNIIGFDRWKDFAQPARPPIHPTFTPCVGTSQPCRFLSETFATYDRADRKMAPYLQ